MKQYQNDLHNKIATELRNGGHSFGHAMATTLKGKKGLVEYYELTHFPKQQEESSPQPVAVAIIKIGNQLVGPAKKIHGGVIALLFDDVMAFASAPLLSKAATKELSVQFKHPMPQETYVQVRVYHDCKSSKEHKRWVSKSSQKSKKRRVFLRATCSGLGTSKVQTAPFRRDDGILYSTATITMVQIEGTELEILHDSEEDKHRDNQRLLSRL